MGALRTRVALVLLLAACAPTDPTVGQVRDAVETPPGLLYPFDYARLPTQTPTLVVRCNRDATQIIVTFEWSVDQFVTSTLANGSCSSSAELVRYTLTSAQALPVGTTVQWRAFSTDGTNFSPYTEAHSFTIGPAGSPVAWEATSESQFRDVADPAGRITTLASGAAVIGFVETPIISDDFESGTLTNWAITNTSPPQRDVQNVAVTGAPSGTRVLKLIDTDTVSGITPDAALDWGVTLVRGAVDFWARFDAPFGRMTLGYFQGGANRYSAGITFRDPTLTVRYYDAMSTVQELTPPVPINLNAWHRYRIEYLDRGSWDLFLDGRRIGTGLPLESPNADLTRFIVHTSTAATNAIADLEIDDLVVLAGTRAGTWRSPPIPVDALGGAFTQVQWTGTTVGATPVRAQLEYATSLAGPWGLAPDTDVPGNAAGFYTSPVVLTSFPGAFMRVRVNINRLQVSDVSSSLDDVVVLGVPTPALGITPQNPTVGVGDALSFSADGGTAPVVFSLDSAPSGGTIGTAGDYTAGLTCGVTDVVKVTDLVGQTATTNVTVPCSGSGGGSGAGGGSGTGGGSGGGAAGGSGGGTEPQPSHLNVACGCAAGGPGFVPFGLWLVWRRRRRVW